MAGLTAEQQLRAMVAASSEPVLSDDEVSTLLALSAVADAGGLPPSHEAWTPTYQLARGAAEGWRWKAAKVADQFDFSSEERSRYQRSQVHAHCLAQARAYARQVFVSAVVPGAVVDTIDPVVA